MTTPNAAQKPAKVYPEPRNGVNTPVLLATIEAVGKAPKLAKFQFRARNRWVSGTHSQSTMHGFFGAASEHQHGKSFMADGDHPAVLAGADNAPTPVEWVLHALATCLTAGIANISAARGINLEMVESTVEGDIDLQGILGLSDKVRNGFQAIRVSFRIKGDATPEKLRAIIEQAKARSAVYDVVTNGVMASIAVEA